MIANPTTWEYRLLSWAHEALTSPSMASPIETKADTLDSAYDYCARVTKILRSRYENQQPDILHGFPFAAQK